MVFNSKQQQDQKKQASHISVDYDSKLLRLVDHNESDEQVLDHLQIALEAEGELYRATDGEIVECDQDQAEAIIRQRKLDEVQRLEEMGVGFVKGDDDWQIEDPDPGSDETHQSENNKKTLMIEKNDSK